MSYSITQKEDYLSKNNTKAIKGILAILVVLHHLNLNFNIFPSNEYISGFFANLGYICVGGFFFFSGYGLICSYKKAGEKYLNDLIPKKIIPLYLLCLVISIGYYFLEQGYKTIKFFKIFYKFGQFGYLWFFETILVFYILFFIFHKLKISDKMKFFLLSFSILLYFAAISVMMVEKSWRICSLFAFILGYAWFYLKNDINEYLQSASHYRLSMVISILLFVGAVAFGHFLGTNAQLKQFLSCLFPVIVILITYKISLSNVVTRFLGNVSLEIYAFQYYIIYFYKYVVVISNVWLYWLCAFISIIVCSVILHPLIKMFLKYIGKLCCKIRDKVFVNFT